MKRLTPVLVTSLVLIPLLAIAAVPLQTPIQGVLRDNAGVPGRRLEQLT